MIDKKELRIGNWVAYGDKHYQVEAILKRNDNYALCFKGLHHGVWIDFVEPIELTEEILLKCGLTRKGSFFGKGFLDTVYWYNLENQILYIEYTDSTFPEDEGMGCPVSSPIKHLHTLMNAIHDLTGKELEYEKD